MTRILRPDVRTIAVPLAAALLLAVTGCGASEAGAAAVVGDRRITVAQVQSAYQDILPVVGPDAQLTQSDVLNWLILQPYLVKAAAENNLGISAEDARDQFRTSDAEPHPSTAALDAVESALAINRLQAGELSQQKVQQVFTGVIDEIGRAKVHVNPRYGRYDPTRLVVSATQESWLASPAPTAGTGGTGVEPTPTP